MPLTAKSLPAVCFLVPYMLSQGYAQSAPKPDALVLVDGERLIGHLESADSKTVLFKSDLAGEVKVSWEKIQELTTVDKFAVAMKGEVFDRHVNTAAVPQGTVSVQNQQITVTKDNGRASVYSVPDTQNVIPQDSFLRAFENTRFRDYWAGTAGLGLALVDATQRSRTFSTSLGLVRTVPAEDWASPRYRSLLTFNSAYGTTTSSGVTIKTNIIHGVAEQDEYLNTKLFVFGQGTFDHNYSQGLSVQYTLGGGLGYIAFKNADGELDFKAQLAYTNQIFFTGPATHLIGGVVSETYNRKFKRGITVDQELSVTPAFNEASDYSANGVLNVGLPITKRLAISLGLLDSYLSNPPPGFRKNSFQFTTNLNYSFSLPK